MDDLVTLAILTASVFLAVLGVGLLVRYRQLSVRINSSSDLGRDLWAALEARLKKQDERVLDVMARLEVIQARVLGRPEPMETSVSLTVPHQKAPKVSPSTQSKEEEGTRPSAGPGAGADTVAGPRIEEEASRDASQTTSQTPSSLDARMNKQDERLAEIMGKLDAIQSRVVEGVIRTQSTRPSPGRVQGRTAEKVPERDLFAVLKERSRTSVEIKDRFDITREHAARVLKDLFERGLVIRNDSRKPFVYELTDEGRRYEPR